MEEKIKELEERIEELENFKAVMIKLFEEIVEIHENLTKIDVTN